MVGSIRPICTFRACSLAASPNRNDTRRRRAYSFFVVSEGTVYATCMRPDELS